MGHAAIPPRGLELEPNTPHRCLDRLQIHHRLLRLCKLEVVKTFTTVIHKQLALIQGLTPQDRVNEFLRQQGSDESKGRGLAWNYWTGFLERFCTALSTSQLDFETKKLLMIPRSFQKQKYDDWKGISEVVKLNCN